MTKKKQNNEYSKNLLCGVKSPGPYLDGDKSIGGLI